MIVAGGTTPSNDIKLVVLLQEAFRHCKAMAAWGSGATLLDSAGISLESPGVLLGGDADKPFGKDLVKALGLHRVWDRAADVMASAVPPSMSKSTPTKRPPAKGRTRRTRASAK